MLALIAAVVAALATGFFGHIGYLGGPVFHDFPPSAGVSRRPAAIVLLSGDMGIRLGMGHDVAERLARDGFPVVGVNSLTYFRVRRTPAEAEALLERAVARARAFGRSDNVVLIGQSFGADLLQVALAQAPAALRTQVRFVGLVVPGDTVAYRASPSEIFGPTGSDADALPTARQLDWAPVTCIQGADETDSLCPALARLPNVTRVALPGGHPMHRDDAAVHGALLRGIDTALGTPPAAP